MEISAGWEHPGDPEARGHESHVGSVPLFSEGPQCGRVGIHGGGTASHREQGPCALVQVHCGIDQPADLSPRVGVFDDVTKPP